MKVEKLLLDGRRWRNIELVNEVLTKNDTVMVSKIPISRQSKLDRMIWRDSSIGDFTVKSTYHVACIVLGKKEACRELTRMQQD